MNPTRFLRELVLLATLAVPATIVEAATHQIVRDSEGRGRYMIILDEAVAEREPATVEAPARSTRDMANLLDQRGWHKANVRALVRRLEIGYGINAFSMTSHAMPAFAAYLSDATLAMVKRDPATKTIYPIYEDAVVFSSWADRWDGSELVPWGKIAIGADDGVTSSTRIYLIDGGARQHDDLFLSFHAPVNSPEWDNLFPEHATHVAGILGARANNLAIRGIDPNVPIINVNRGKFEDEVAAAFDWVLTDAEQSGVYAIANISTNGTSYANGILSKYIRRASTRVLVVESAGNNLGDACASAYSATNIDDGILVVGGIDEFGQQAIPYDNTGLGIDWHLEAGSNSGRCVEVWAPSERIWSTWSTSSTAVNVLSGTSMAAPHVSAFAARFGNELTTPLERENFVRGKLVGTGAYDSSGIWIQIPSYTQPSYSNIGTRLGVYAISADASMSGTSPWNLVDSLYLSGVWNAGHGAPAWVEIDLGAQKTVTRIRLTPEQDPEGAVVHYIYAGSSPSPTNLVATISGNGATLEPFAASLGAPARYVRIYTVSSPSWVAWREIELYGY